MSLLKRKPYRNKKILAAAKGQPCYLRIPGVCTGGGADTVACHSNLGEDGKGGSQKADDCFISFGCQACHDEYDGRTHKSGLSSDFLQYFFDRGMKRTWRNLLDRGIIS
ncbi:MAG: nuclease domain-containing protein [bacterium]